jgi:hypothetical protein
MQQTRYIIFIFLIFISTDKGAQTYAQQRTEVLLVNIISNSLMGGVGGAIHKKEGEKTSVAFAKGFFKGTLGGLVKYYAKDQSRHLYSANNHFYAPINRLQYFLGHSFVMNAARGQKLLSTYYCNLYGIDLRLSINAKPKLKARISAASVISAGVFGFRKFELNIYKSLEMGQLYFDVHRNLLPGAGQAAFNCIAIEQPGGNFSISNSTSWPHETVHTYQMYDYFSLAAIYDPWIQKKFTNNTFLSTLSKVFVADYEVLYFTGIYLTQPKPTYYRNFFEFEAQHFATHQRISRKDP